MSILKKVNYPMDIKKLDIIQLQDLASDIRKLIIASVVQNGGHLSANLGVVELTIALHYVFDIPKDKLIFDVGHQCYTHKILTGRKNDFENLRKSNGISGFPKTQESIFDCANSGHASTALAISNGLSSAQIANSTSKIISLIGDGAFTGGLFFEALNNFSNSDKNNRVIILNDNDMAISKNVGYVDKFLKEVKFNGDTTFFEKFGIEYYGTVDGHDFNKLIKAFNYAKDSEKSIFIHVVTTKGKGYEIAEKNPIVYHGYPSTKFNPITFSNIVGAKLCQLASENANIVAITAAMSDGTGLVGFAKTFPDRFYDVGIAENYAVVFSAGLSLGGKKPYFAVYSTFLQRAYDGVVHDICLNNLPAVICLDRSGFVGYDGETHQGIYDISFLRCLPNINIICPKDQKEMESALDFSVNFNAPLVIRYPKGYINYDYESSFKDENFQIGKWQLLTQTNSDIYLLACGAEMCAQAMKCADLLSEEKGILINVVNVNCIKPLDVCMLDKLSSKTLITLEDNTILGGFGSSVAEYYLQNQKYTKLYIKGVPDKIFSQATKSELLAMAELDFKSIAQFVVNILCNEK